MSKLLVGDGKIGRFAGRGELPHFVRSVAVREAISQERKQSGREIAVDTLPPISAESTDPELGFLQAAYREPFKAAFSQALASLSLLRLGRGRHGRNRLRNRRVLRDLRRVGRDHAGSRSGLVAVHK